MKIIKSIIFMVILMVIGGGLYNVLGLKDSISEFFEEPKNTMDIVYVGPSNVYLHFNTTLAFQEYGFTTGLLSNGAQSPAVMEYLIKESRKYQNPKLYILDITKFIESLSDISEGNLRLSLDAMPFSWNRIEAINSTLKYYHLNFKDYINYYFRFLKYHNSWKKISKQNFTKIEFVFKGFMFNSENIQIKPQKLLNWNYEIETIETENQYVLNNLLNYLDKENLNCIFVIPKKNFDETRMKKMNFITKIIENRNYKVINFNKIDDFQIDSENDFLDVSHLNIYGSTKFTLYFAKYLHEHYDLPDHRNDKKYNSWNEDYDRFKEQYKKLTQKNFIDLLNEDKIFLKTN